MSQSDEVVPALPGPRPPAADAVGVALAVPDPRGWLESLVVAVGASGAAVFTPDDGGALAARWSTGYPEEILEAWRRLSLAGTPAGEAYSTGRLVVVVDAVTAPDFPKLRATRRGEGSALVAVPIPSPTAGAAAPLGVLGVSFASGEALLAAGVRWADAARDVGVLLGPPGSPAGVLGPAHHQGAGSDAVVRLATRLLAAATPEDVLDEVTSAALPALGADLVNICLIEPGGATLRLVVSRSTPVEVELAYATFALDAPLPAGDALRSGRPVLMHTLAERDALYPALASVVVEQQAFAALPLQAAGRPLGAITFGWTVEQEFGPAQVRTLEAVAAWCSAALLGAHRHEAEMEARARAEHALARLDGLRDLMGDLARATDEAAVSDVVVTSAARALGAHAAAIVGVDAEGDVGVVTVVGAPRERLVRWVTAAESPLAAELATGGTPILLRSPAELAARYPELAADDLVGRAWAFLPLVVDRTHVGVAAFAWSAPQEGLFADLPFLGALADHAATAVQRARLLATVRGTAETLQRALLPQLVSVAGWELAAHYAPAAEGTQVGGDWYDAFVLPDGRVGLALGDVMGKGVAAAAIMGAVRSALRAYASIDPAPARVLARLGDYVAAYTPDQLVTCTYLVLDPVSGAVEHASAGHPPALVTGPDGGRWLDDAVNPPLNAPPVGPLVAAAADLDAGDVLVLYSDGLVERRGHDLAVGLADLEASAGKLQSSANLDAACRALADGLAHDDRNVDDIAVLALRRSRGQAGGSDRARTASAAS